MIRSLIIVPAEEPSEEGKLALRRNLAQTNLEECLLSGDCTAWIDIVSPDEKEIRWLEDLLKLAPNIVEDLLREDRRPSLMVYPNYLFLSLLQPQLQTSGIISKEIHCIMGERYFVTVRGSEATALEEAYNRVAQNPDAWSRGVAYFLYLTSQNVIDTYYPLLDRISNQLNGLQEKLMGGETDKHNQKSVYRLNQYLISLRQMIAPQREVVSNLIGEARVSGNADVRDLFRHLYERLLRIYDVIDSQRDLTNNVLEMIANQQSRKMGEAVNRLTIFSMIFLPLTFFMSLFDANIATITTPLAIPVNGTVMFIILMTLMLSLVVSMVLLFRHRGWA